MTLLSIKIGYSLFSSENKRLRVRKYCCNSSCIIINSTHMTE